MPADVPTVSRETSGGSLSVVVNYLKLVSRMQHGNKLITTMTHSQRNDLDVMHAIRRLCINCLKENVDVLPF